MKIITRVSQIYNKSITKTSQKYYKSVKNKRKGISTCWLYISITNIAQVYYRSFTKESEKYFKLIAKVLKREKKCIHAGYTETVPNYHHYKTTLLKKHQESLTICWYCNMRWLGPFSFMFFLITVQMYESWSDRNLW